MNPTSIDHERLAENLVRALSTRDRELMLSVLTEDFVEDYPQSGERIRGFNNYWAIGENYPGGQPAQELSSLDTRPAAAVKLIAPSCALVSVEGGGNSGTATVKNTYPDGSVWWGIMLYRLRDGRIARSTTFFAPAFPAPEWRAQWVERM
jgi:hypothetical protein